MKLNVRTLWTVVMLAWVLGMGAQDIKIMQFERNMTSLIASVNPVFDNAGDACAVIQFMERDRDFIIEPNLGVLKSDTLPGEVRLWVPKGTKRITVRHEGMMPLTGYVIPMMIESKVTYTATIEAVDHHVDNDRHVYLGAGYNLPSVAGPSVMLGFKTGPHIVELDAVYSLNKSDDLFFFNSQSDVTEAYQYQALRIQLRYGYALPITKGVSVSPLVGGCVNLINGSSVDGFTNTDNYYQKAQSLSASAALRLAMTFSDNVQLHITPEYDYGLMRDNNAKWMSDYDKTFKRWTDGFNLNIGLMVFF